MSMLAEPRRKQKWTLNPRGKEWSEDSNKFGQKMLEKMGWTSGKGLGANEQGITEHVRVSLKNDTSGIGFKKDVIDEAWTEHQDSFNDFLQKLQQQEGHNVVQTEESKDVLSGKSLELKSKQSRVRVHYQKFIKGKDINKYSSKDLANIFGQKELNINKSNKEKEDNCEEAFDPVGTQDTRSGVITINGGNMTEYFMKKGQDFSLTPKNKRWEKNNSESEPEYAGFGFASAAGKVQSRENEESKENQNVCKYAFENPCVQLNSPENVSHSNSESKSPKKRKSNDNELSRSNKVKKLKEDSISENEYKNGIVNDGLNLETQSDMDCNGKEFEVSRVQFGVTNSALDLSDEADDKKRVRFNDHVEYSTDSVKKKKGTLDKFEVENKKIKKKKKHSASVNNPISSGFVNEALDVIETAEEIYDNEINERKSKKSKKRKGSRRSNLETIVEIPEDELHEDETEIKRAKVEDNTLDDSVLQDVPSKKKKKKHKEKIEIFTENKHDIEALEKEVISEIQTTFEKEKCEFHEDLNSSTKSKKKKKKYKVKDIELNLEKDENVIPVTENEVDNVQNVEVEGTESETAKIKKKKTKKNSDVNDLSATASIKDEKEVSDKENTKNMDEHKTNKLHQKKSKETVNESVDNSTHSIQCTETSVKRTNVATNAYSRRFANTTSSPWNDRAKMSKRLLKSLFHRNSVIDFPGSNIHEIKGYGADM